MRFLKLKNSYFTIVLSGRVIVELRGEQINLCPKRIYAQWTSINDNPSSLCFAEITHVAFIWMVLSKEMVPHDLIVLNRFISVVSFMKNRPTYE